MEYSQAGQLVWGPHGPPLVKRALPLAQGVALRKVQSAKALYDLTRQVLDFCVTNNIPVSVENPNRSHFWDTIFFKSHSEKHSRVLFESVFHHCMSGSERKNASFASQIAHHLVILRFCVMIAIYTFHGAMSSLGNCL